MGATAEKRGQRKESVNWNIEQQILPKLSNREKIDLKKRLRDLCDYNKHSCHWSPGKANEERPEKY